MSDVIDRRTFLRASAGGVVAGSLIGPHLLGAEPARRLNVLLITADDMNYNTPGCFGGKMLGITPNLDRLAGEGMRFDHAHVQIAVCQPSRQALMTGRYPHTNGGLGFDPINRDVPTLQEQLRAAGYMNGVFSKQRHMRPTEKFPWDTVVGKKELGYGRSPERYFEQTRAFIAEAAKAGKPFFLMANSDDPHRPLAHPQLDKRMAARRKDWPKLPFDSYKADQVEVPGFLADLPMVREDLVGYYNSCRRCDLTVGAILRALKESGQERNTVVMFLSDHGMPFPFAKTNCYMNSTRTPWIVRWPGRIKPGAVEREQMISAIDFMPTILEATGLAGVPGMDGRSFVPVLGGGKQDGRDAVFTVFNTTVRKAAFPMRCLNTPRFGYIFNAWADGKTVFVNNAKGSLAFRAMAEAAKTDPKIAARVKTFDTRAPEEFFDYTADPDALHNLIDDPKHRAQIDRMRGRLLAVMKQTRDPQTGAFQRFLAAKAAPGTQNTGMKT